MTPARLSTIATFAALLAVFAAIGLLVSVFTDDHDPSMTRLYASTFLGCAAVAAIASLLGGRIHWK